MLATSDCLRALGASVEGLESGVCTVRGLGGRPLSSAKTERHLYCRESGSTLRFLLPLCLLDGVKSVLHGKGRLLSRPLGIYEELCRERGIFFEQNAECVTVCGRLTAGEYVMRGDVSSQFITGLLFALPLLEGDSRIRLTTHLESRSYLDLTVDALRTFGICVEFIGEREILVPGGQHYRSVDATVEGDHSNAAFFGALNALGGDVIVDGLREDSLQGDRVWKQHMDALVEGSPTISLADCPDLGPVLMAVAAAKQGATFTEIHRLRLKESDRVASVIAMIESLGGKAEATENTLTVYGTGLLGGTVDSFGDHRIAMAAAIAATVCKEPVTILGAECVKKSYPGFWEDHCRLGGNYGQYLW
jgi:3-phosphoshikimate 1-carboxyvinyltransferase